MSRLATLGVLYVVGAAGLVVGAAMLLHGHPLAWVVLVTGAIVSLLVAYRVRTGRRPWHRGY